MTVAPSKPSHGPFHTSTASISAKLGSKSQRIDGTPMSGWAAIARPRVPHELREVGELVVLRSVAPVDPGARGQARRDPVAGAGRDLLAGDDEEVVLDVGSPHVSCAESVLWSALPDEVQGPRPGVGEHVGLRLRSVGVDGVDVQVAAPPALGFRRGGGGRRRCRHERRPARPKTRDPHLVVDG